MYTPPDDPEDEPEHLTQHLAAPIAATWRAFDRGRTSADEFFNSEPSRSFDPHLWAHITRYEAVLSLKSEPAPRDWELRLTHHSGIELTMDGFRIKVGKASAGGPQSPGRNRRRMSYYQQLGLLPRLFGSDQSNLILYWMVRGGDLELGLCKPKGLWSFRGQPKLEWRQPVRYDPLAGLSFTTADENESFSFEDDAASAEVRGE